MTHTVTTELDVAQLNTQLINIKRNIAQLNTEFDFSLYNYYVDSYVQLVHQMQELIRKTQLILGSEATDQEITVNKNLYITAHSDKINFPIITKLQKMSVNTTMRKIESEFSAFQITINDTYSNFAEATRELNTEVANTDISETEALIPSLINNSATVNRGLTPEEKQEAVDKTNTEIENNDSGLPDELDTDNKDLNELLEAYQEAAREANDTAETARESRADADAKEAAAQDARDKADEAQAKADAAFDDVARTDAEKAGANSIMDMLNGENDNSLTVYFSDGSTATVTITNNDDGTRTETYSATLADGNTYTYTTNYDQEGEKTSSTVSVNGGEARETDDTAYSVAKNNADDRNEKYEEAKDAYDKAQAEADADEQAAQNAEAAAQEAQAKADADEQAAKDADAAAKDAQDNYNNAAGNNTGKEDGDFFNPDAAKDDDSGSDSGDDGGNVICTYIIECLFTGLLQEKYKALSNENIKIALKAGADKRVIREYTTELGPLIISYMRNCYTIKDLCYIWNSDVIPIWLLLRQDGWKGYIEYCKFVKKMAEKFDISLEKWPHIREMEKFLNDNRRN